VSAFVLTRFVAIVAIVAIASPDRAVAGSLDEISGFGDNPGKLKMFSYVPPGLPGGSPLVVVVHGCLQSARDVADHSGWIEMARTYRFALLFPQTSKENEPTFGCFRTWEPAYQQRDAGEPKSIQQMVAWLIDRENLDERRVFITGVSSGGLVTNGMLAAYPDLFAAGAAQSAYPYRCASTYSEIPACAAGEYRPSDGWGALALQAYPDFDGHRPAVSIWHGDSDAVIRPTNLALQLEQWTTAIGIDSTADEVEVIEGHLRRRYNDANGIARVETYEIRGLGHAFAIDPDGTPACGKTADYFADAGICSALWIARWFGIVR
jgi:poly(hydroxyalkanoate) depolymerase family esterase